MSNKHARDEASPLIKRKLWIDTDCMVGRVDGNLISGRADQDDGFALVAMLHLPALFDVVGVSSVFGRSSDESSSSHSATSTKHAAKIAAMKAMKAAAEQAEAKLKTKKEKAKAAAEKATKNVLEQAMPVDVTPTKEEAAAVHICVAGLSQLPPVAPGSRRAARRTSAMGCASPSSFGRNAQPLEITHACPVTSPLGSPISTA